MDRGQYTTVDEVFDELRDDRERARLDPAMERHYQTMAQADLRSVDDEERMAREFQSYRRAKERRRAKRRQWQSPERMTQSEVSLRFAMHLVDVLGVREVSVALTAYEMVRKDAPRVDLAGFLEPRGFDFTGHRRDWRGAYERRSDRAPGGAPAATVLLHDRHGEGDVVARLDDGRRLIAEVSSGPVQPTRSPTEHRMLRSVIGRAVTTESATSRDVICAVVPRSARFRDLIREWRAAQRLVAAGIQLVMVDRIGGVHGLEL